MPAKKADRAAAIAKQKGKKKKWSKGKTGLKHSDPCVRQRRSGG